MLAKIAGDYVGSLDINQEIAFEQKNYPANFLRIRLSVSGVIPSIEAK